MICRIAVVLGLAVAPVLATSYTFSRVDVCEGCTALASNISNSGVVVGSVTDTTGSHGYFGTPGSWTLFDVPGALTTEAISINNAGIIGGDTLDSAFVLRAYRRETDGTINLIPSIPGYPHMGGGNLNNTGTTVGNVAIDLFDGPAYGFVIRDGITTVPIQYAGANITQLSNINDAGVTAGYIQESASSIPHGFIRQSDGTFVPFEVPGAAGTQLYGINNLGHIAGGYYDPDGTTHGFIYADREFTTLDFTGPNTMIFGLNDLDQVAGISYPVDGFFTGPYTGFTATPVPEPSTVMLTAAAVFVCIVGAYRRRTL